jgi:outer membrane receptor protein involved in Fe transport
MDRWISDQSDYTDYSFWYDTLYGYGAYWTNNAGKPVDPSQYITAKDKFTKQSHEIRLSSPSDWRMRFVVGGFFERQTHWIFQDYKINDIGTDIQVPGWPSTIWLTDQTRIDRDAAVFGELSYDILPNLTATGGVRVFSSRNTLDGFFGFGAGYSSHTGVSQCPDPNVPGPNGAPCVNLDKGVNETGETHKLNLAWHVDDDRMLYATYSTGFRPGGINRRGTIPPYKPDTLTNYEVGWKTAWFQNQLRFNGSLFYEQWDDLQYAVLGQNSFTEIHNAGQAVIKGAESDIDWLIDEHFSLTGSATVADANLTSTLCGVTNPANDQPVTQCPGPLDPNPPWAGAGTQLPVTPKYKGNLTGRYQWNIGDFLAHFQATLSGQSGSWADLRVQAPNPVTGVEYPIRAALGKQPGFNTVDFTLGIENDSWHAELFIENAFDTRADLSTYAECTTQICGNEPYIVPNVPRMIGIKFGQKF